MQISAWRWGVTLGLALLGMQCSPGQLSGGKPEGALDLFGLALEKGNLQQACDSLDWACENNVNGELSCVAKALLCGATVEETCAKLHLTCAHLIASCNIHHAHCLDCGDGICMAGEDCGGCPADCGACPGGAECPGGVCGVPGGAECPSGICGVPGSPVCGDAICMPGEDCGICPADCGACPVTKATGVCEWGMQTGGGGGFYNWIPVECNADMDCTQHVGAQQNNLTHCYNGPSPEGGGALTACVRCAEDSHCKVGPYTTGKCMLPGHSKEPYADFRCNRCDTDADCQGTELGPKCNGQHCTDCLGDGDCVKGSANTGKCRLYQNSAGLQYGSCTFCTADEDCQGTGLGGICDTGTGNCVDCIVDSYCAGAQKGTLFCFQGSCSGCTQKSDCQLPGGGGGNCLLF